MQPSVTKSFGLLAASIVCLLATACGPTASGQPAAPTTARTMAPTQTPPLPTAVSVTSTAEPPTKAPVTSTAGSAPAASNPSTASKPAPASAVKLVVDPSTSQARYHAREQLAGRSLPSEAVGTSGSVSGALVLAADGSIVAGQSEITVDLTSLHSDEGRRDNWIKGNTLQISRFPSATFVPRETQGLPNPLPTSGQSTFQLSGDLTVHGVTKPVTWQVTAQFADSTVSGNATTTVNITDFGMTPPKVGPVLGIDDGLTLELAFTAAPHF
jgi:polyisoprenoid-binding protein YceI